MRGGEEGVQKPQQNWIELTLCKDLNAQCV